MEELYGSYLDELLKKRHVTATPEQRIQLLTYLDRQVNTALLEALPDEYLDKLENAATAGTVSDDMIERFLTENGKDPEAIISSTLEKFEKQFLKEEK